MIRIIVKTTDASRAANVGGSIIESFKTFDIDLPEVEKFLCEYDDPECTSYVDRQIIGVEVVP